MLTVADIVAIAPGKVKSSATAAKFALIAPRNGGYEIECGWIVPEAFFDDYDSYTYHPFGRARPWVGRRIFVEDVQAALATYERFKLVVHSAKLDPGDGEWIGSVSRSPPSPLVPAKG